ncbi:hypothetical protein AM2010_1822 [Pelagerythrobacter marensis]|uniref:Uncharacterized protein n=1 Tax=Pelagerythrobacter marensis TaxID=543877 RepID=A0A0G3X8K6_9SPHN|nr:hypothetical protein AM2010_1822 [Pelagerythrobacter marensis]
MRDAAIVSTAHTPLTRVRDGAFGIARAQWLPGPAGCRFGGL